MTSFVCDVLRVCSSVLGLRPLNDTTTRGGMLFDRPGARTLNWGPYFEKSGYDLMDFFRTDRKNFYSIE